MKTIYWTNWTDRPFITRQAAEQCQAKTEAPELGEITECLAISKDELLQLLHNAFVAGQDGLQINAVDYLKELSL